ncbi:endocuticle structural glycoprotein SgAbd-8-like [Dendroctonus ponderosae]|uniref:Uncharacterized protein n=1 Tax=Dendroctonus ponderosae TaxID=77166 RepID=U4TZV8_DENPD|nr:endocuticle structural glycoprotein SgAbd-8-like [Dendroctonus ponderosae]ERL83841.1 hypothetical protein D910_01099 [Dendroctonus ponderosae]KAH1004879.1 hypothetical protein HUJ05_005647 [Dendroctonus ponderosae]
MFSKLIVFSAVVALTLAGTTPVPIISQSQNVDPDGSFQWAYQSGDGTVQEQAGKVVLLRSGEDAETVQGSASWVDPEGNPHQLSYVADEGGYRPQSADLPIGPPLPPLIAKALKWIQEHPSSESPEV